MRRLLFPRVLIWCATPGMTTRGFRATQTVSIPRPFGCEEIAERPRRLALSTTSEGGVCPQSGAAGWVRGRGRGGEVGVQEGGERDGGDDGVEVAVGEAAGVEAGVAVLGEVLLVEHQRDDVDGG